MGKRFLSLLLILCILAAIVPAPSVLATSTQEAQTVVYIPLDNRPFNDARLQMMADSLNIELITPDEDLYSTKLDGQPLNSNGTQYGNREALLTWLQEMDQTYDTFIISLDQLLSGGLMNSRCMSDFQSLEFSDGSSMTEYEVIDYLAELAENNELYIIDSVVRLATSCDYGGYNLTHYNIFRTYGAVGRPILSGKELTVENIIANYSYAADGYTKAYVRSKLTTEEISILLSPMDTTQSQSISDAMKSTYLQRKDPASYEESQTNENIYVSIIEAENSMLSTYLGVRSRKLRLTNYAMEQLCDMPSVHYLLGVDDSSEGNNIQRNEIALFKTHLSGSDDQIFSALDGLGQLALSKVFFSEYPMDNLDVSVTYLGDKADTVLSYNCYTAREIMDQTINYYGANQVQDNPDLSIVVLTPSAQSAKNLCTLVSLLNENEVDKLPTILVDLTESQEPNLNTMLLENTHLGMLLSYSGKTEIPNGIIMALSQGFSRYHALEIPKFQTENTQQAHILNLATALVKEFGFTDGAYSIMTEKLTELGINTGNFGAIDATLQETIFTELTQSVSTAASSLLENLSSSNFITSLQPYTVGSIENVSIISCEYPWLRHMEIDCTLTGSWSDIPYDLGTFHHRYIDGMTETTFSPDSFVTRNQTAKLLVTAANIAVTDPTGSCPDDVALWAWPSVSFAIQYGYIRGYPDGSFHGDNNITRAEFATMLMQYILAEDIVLDSTSSISFSDVPDSDATWYSKNVYTLARAEIIQGYPDGSFRPDEYISRVEAVTLLNRLMNRTETLSNSLLQITRFTDVTAQWHIFQIQEGSISHFCKTA